MWKTPVWMIVPLFFCSCVTVDENGNEVVEREVKPKKGTLERAHDGVDRRIERLAYQQGKELLQTLQELIAMKEVAYEPIARALPSADPRTRANLVYVLGFLGGNQSHRVVAQHLRDENEAVRFEAAAALMAMGDWSAVPVLMSFMDSDNRRMRFKSHQVLADATRQDFGFQFDAPDGDRANALGRWRNWWQNRREEIIYGDASPASAN